MGAFRLSAVAAALLSLAACSDISRLTGMELRPDGGQQAASQRPAPAAPARSRAETLYRDGLRHMEGSGVPVDMARAAELIGQSADLGHAESQYLLGTNAALRGALTRPPEAPALWLTRAALQGHARAQQRLGDAYASGAGVGRDLPWAALWYNRAAERGVPEAQLAFGRMLARGQGTARDPAEAYGWLGLAAAAGQAEAAAERSGLEGALDPAARRAADARVRAQRRAGSVGHPDRPLIRFAQSALRALQLGNEAPSGRATAATRQALAGFARAESLVPRDPWAPAIIARLRDRSRAALSGG